MSVSRQEAHIRPQGEFSRVSLVPQATGLRYTTPDNQFSLVVNPKGNDAPLVEKSHGYFTVNRKGVAEATHGDQFRVAGATELKDVVAFGPGKHKGQTEIVTLVSPADHVETDGAVLLKAEGHIRKPHALGVSRIEVSDLPEDPVGNVYLNGVKIGKPFTKPQVEEPKE